MQADEVLAKAEQTVNGDRADEYGEAEESFSRIAALWELYLGQDVEILPHDVAAMMALLKISRLAGGTADDLDSWLDLAGYAALGAQVAKAHN